MWAALLKNLQKLCNHGIIYYICMYIEIYSLKGERISKVTE